MTTISFEIKSNIDMALLLKKDFLGEKKNIFFFGTDKEDRYITCILIKI